MRPGYGRFGYPLHPKGLHVSRAPLPSEITPFAWRSGNGTMFLDAASESLSPQGHQSVTFLKYQIHLREGEIKSRAKKELDFIILEDCEWESVFEAPTRESNQGIYYKQRKSITEHF